MVQVLVRLGLPHLVVHCVSTRFEVVCLLSCHALDGGLLAVRLDNVVESVVVLRRCWGVHAVLVEVLVELAPRLLFCVLALADQGECGAVLCRIVLEGVGIFRVETHETHRVLAVLDGVPEDVLGLVGVVFATRQFLRFLQFVLALLRSKRPRLVTQLRCHATTRSECATNDGLLTLRQLHWPRCCGAITAKRNYGSCRETVGSARPGRGVIPTTSVHVPPVAKHPPRDDSFRR